MKIDTIICTADQPWNKESIYGVRVQHPDAKHVGEDYDFYGEGDYDEYECPHCKHQFRVQLPD